MLFFVVVVVDAKQLRLNFKTAGFAASSNGKTGIIGLIGGESSETSRCLSIRLVVSNNLVLSCRLKH